jgi:hypothetical protein
MTRPVHEVADIVRTQGHRFLEKYGSVINYQQLKALRAIRNCRTAILGHHVDACPKCEYTTLSYNSCLMGSIWLWGVLRWEGAQPLSHTPFKLPIKVWLLVTQSACPVD